MTPDPLASKLARFTPDAGALDPAEVLFRAGRASARTPRVWKFAVFGLVLTNAVALVGGQRQPTRPELLPGPPLVAPAAATDAGSPPEASPWSSHTLLGSFDPDRAARPESVAGLEPAKTALTPLSARRGDID